MQPTAFRFVTDTATMCIFDLESLKHRLQDDADWWSLPAAEVEEVNKGNAVFLGLGEDGQYEVAIVESLCDHQVQLNLRAPSGRLFIGAAEEATSDGLEPEKLRGGEFVSVSCGNYVLLARRDGHRIMMALSPGGPGVNSVEVPVRLDEATCQRKAKGEGKLLGK